MLFVAMVKFFFVLLGFLSVVTLAKKENDLNEPSKNRYELHPQCEDVLQEQINEEHHASLVYMNMAAHFGSNGIARDGFRKFFSDSGIEEREHAQKFIDYINKRGGKVRAFDVKMPVKDSWPTALEALEDAQRLEEHVNNKLHHVHDMAERVCKDAHMMDFIEGEFLKEQVKSIDELRRFFAILSAMNNGMGEYFLDRQLAGKDSEKP